VANGAFMLTAPQPWYVAAPGVTLSGSYNPHFIRDIGAIYLAIGASLAWTARHPGAWPAGAVAAGWLAAHALIHLRDAAFCGRPPLPELLRDLPVIYVPATISVIVVLAARASRKQPA
jgi:hypothetical protein